MVETPKQTNALQHLLDMIAPQAMGVNDTGYQGPQTIDVNGQQVQVPAMKNSQGGASKGGGMGGSSGMPIMSPEAWMKQGAGNFTIPGAPPIPGGSAASQGKGGLLGSQGGHTGKGGGTSAGG